MLEIDKERLEKLSHDLDFLETERPDEFLSQQIYKMLLCLLLDNTIKPGTVLSRRELAELFGVSVAPVLEALVSLERDGFITTVPRKGTVVKSFSQRDVLDSLYVREAIECQAARMYCGRKIKDNFDMLMPIAVKIDNSISGLDEDNWISELRFHRTLITLADSNSLTKIFSLHYQIGVFYTAYKDLIENQSMQESDSHQELLVKLQIDDPDFAERCIRRHVRSTIQKFEKSF